MAIYHCNCKVIGRNSGRTSVGASAYRSGTKMKNEYDGVTHDYTSKSGVVYSEVMLCQNAPEEWNDRTELWNAVEKIETAKDSQLCREYEVALPKELTMEENIKLTKEFARKFVEDGMCVDFAIHDKEDGNPHAHIMTTIRPLNENGKWKAKTQKLYICKNSIGEERNMTADELKDSDFQKLYKYNVDKKVVWLTKSEAEQYEHCKRISKEPKSVKFGKRNDDIERWNSEKYLIENREVWANLVNNYLERNGIKDHVDHRSYIEQGIEKEPMEHLGVSALQMEMRGKVTDRGNINRKIIRQNIVKGVIEIDPDKGKGFEHWCKIYNLKQEAKSFALLSEKRDKLTELQSKANEIHQKIESLDEEIAKQDNILKYANTYKKYYPVYRQYQETKSKGKFYKENEKELIIFNSAKAQLKKIHGEGKLSLSILKDDLAALKKEKASLYQEQKKVSMQLIEYKIALDNMKKLLQKEFLEKANANRIEHHDMEHN